MQTIALRQVRLVPAWSPAPRPRPWLAQQAATPPQAPVTPPMPAPAPAAPAPAPPAAPTKPPFIDSALVQSLQAFTGAFVTGMLAYGATYPGRADVKPSRWAYVFLALAAGLVVKGFADLSRVRER